MFLPNANSPLSVDGPSLITSPASTLSPFLTIGLWFEHVPWFERLNLIRLYSSIPFLVLIVTGYFFISRKSYKFLKLNWFSILK